MNSIKSNKEEMFARLKRKASLRQSPRNDPASRLQEHRALIIEACAKADLLLKKRAHKRPELIRPFWKEPLLPSCWQVKAAGGWTAIKKRIKQGGLGIKGPWTGDLILGLKISGALRQCKHFNHGTQHYIPKYIRPVLLESLSNKPFCYSVNNLFISSPMINYYPPETGDGEAVIAGMLGGALIKNGWLCIPDTQLGSGLLEAWSILYKPDNGWLRVSPFYGALFAAWLPDAMAQRITDPIPALCPLLPAIYWDLCLREKYREVIPFANALPYGCSPKKFFKLGWHRRDMYGMARSIGIYHVHPKLQNVIKQWWKQFKSDRKQSLVDVIDAGRVSCRH